MILYCCLYVLPFQNVLITARLVYWLTIRWNAQHVMIIMDWLKPTHAHVSIHCILSTAKQAILSYLYPRVACEWHAEHIYSHEPYLRLISNMELMTPSFIFEREKRIRSVISVRHTLTFGSKHKHVYVKFTLQLLVYSLLRNCILWYKLHFVL